MLRSVLSKLEFTYLIRKYDAEGIPFRSHLHVPENHPITGSIFFEREDPGHVLKVCQYTHIIWLMYSILFNLIENSELH